MYSFCLESGKAGSTGIRLREAWPRTTLLCRMRKVRLLDPYLYACAQYRLHPLDTTRQIPHYGHIGRVKFINDDARLSKNRHIRLRNLSVPPGWEGKTDVWLQSLTTPCRNRSHILLLEVCRTVYLNSHCHTQPGRSTTSLFGPGYMKADKGHTDRRLCHNKDHVFMRKSACRPWWHIILR